MKESNNAQQLKNAIAMHYNKTASLGRCNSFRVVARAMVSTGVRQSRARIARGWVCGYYTSKIRQRIQTELESHYSEAALEDLVRYCSQDDLVPEWEVLLDEISQKVPRVYINGL